MAAKKGAAKARQKKPGGGTRTSKAALPIGRRKTRRVAAAAGYSRAKAQELTPAQLRSLTGQLKAAPAVARPLKGFTVPRVDLKRGAQGPAVKQLQRALVKLRMMTQAPASSGH